MDIRSIAHKALRRSFEKGIVKGLVGDVERTRRMLVFTDNAASLEELSAPPNVGLHELTGDRAGTWAMTLTRNWGLTFRMNEQGKIEDMDELNS